jgi:SSS family transporter
MNSTTWGLAFYVLITLGIGYWVSRRIHSEEDYLLGGRSFGYPLAIFSIFATWFGAETCVSSAASVYDSGIAGSAVEPFGYAFCILFMGAVFAVPLYKRRLVTLGDLFEQRFSRSTAMVAVILMIPTSLIWAAAQIRAFGQVLDVNTGWGLETSISAAALIVVIYTAMGGLKADAITDLIQGILLIIGIFIVFLAVTRASGGFMTSLQNVEPDRLKMFTANEGNFMDMLETWSIPICGSVIAQELVARVLAAKNVSIARNGTLIGGGLYLLVGLMPVYLGLVGGQLIPSVEDSEQIVPLLAREHLHSLLFIIFAGALISAILSTVDSALLACGALLSHNLILPLMPDLSPSRKLIYTRATVVTFGILAYFFALKAGRIYDLIETASSFGTSGVFVVMVMGLFTRIGGPASAIATLIVGLISFVIGEYAIPDYNYSFITSLACAITTFLLTSVWTRRIHMPQSPA